MAVREVDSDREYWVVITLVHDTVHQHRVTDKAYLVANYLQRVLLFDVLFVVCAVPNPTINVSSEKEVDERVMSEGAGERNNSFRLP